MQNNNALRFINCVVIKFKAKIPSFKFNVKDRIDEQEIKQTDKKDQIVCWYKRRHSLAN